MNKRLIGVAAAVALTLSAASLYAVHPTRASDHQDSPVTISRPGADITDPYLFPSPTTPTNAVVVMNVHPLIPSGQGGSTYFDPGVVYQMNFDTTSENGSQFPAQSITRNEVIQFTFGPAGPNQSVTVYGPAAAPTTTSTTTLAAQSGTGTIGQSFTVSNGAIHVFAGAREDPFFFDLAQFLKILPDRNQGSTAPSCLPKLGDGTCPQGFNNPGSDTLKGYNVLSIVVELPRTTLEAGGGPKIAYWTSTHTVSGQ
jgi:hypothetical protein